MVTRGSSLLLGLVAFMALQSPADAHWRRRAAPEWAFYHVGPDLYRERPEEAEERLREAEEACRPVLYTRPESAGRAAWVARRCRGR